MILRPDDAIDLVQPINWLAPLTRGLKAAYHCLPGLMGGRRLVNLVDPGSHDNQGTLANFDMATAWKPARMPPNGWGALNPDGTNDYVACGVRGLPRIEAAKSVTCRVYVDSGTETRNVWAMVLNDTGSANNSCALMFGTGFSIRQVYIERWGGSVVARYFPIDYGLNNAWNTITFTWNGTTPRLYANGFDRTFDTGTFADTGATGVFSIGRFNATFTGDTLDQPLDMLWVHDRVLSPKEVYDLHIAVLERFPKELNRIRRPVWFVPAAGGVTLPALDEGMLVGGLLPLAGGLQ